MTIQSVNTALGFINCGESEYQMCLLHWYSQLIQHQGFLDKTKFKREKNGYDIKCNAKQYILIWSKVKSSKLTEYCDLKNYLIIWLERDG